jgi:hypothetical protein
MKCQKDHSHPYVANAKNKASHLSAPPTCLDSTNSNNFTIYCYMFRKTDLERLYTLAAVLLKFQVFWYVMPYCWSKVPDVSKDCSAFIFRLMQCQQSIFFLDCMTLHMKAL